MRLDRQETRRHEREEEKISHRSENERNPHTEHEEGVDWIVCTLHRHGARCEIVIDVSLMSPKHLTITSLFLSHSTHSLQILFTRRGPLAVR